MTLVVFPLLGDDIHRGTEQAEVVRGVLSVKYRSNASENPGEFIEK